MTHCHSFSKLSCPLYCFRSLKPSSSQALFRSFLSGAAVLAFLWVLVFAADAQGAKLFSTSETPHKGLKAFPNWVSVLERHFKDLKETEKNCQKCAFARWFKLINQLQGKDKGAQLYTVNKFMNKNKYIVDKINWGLTDYWATPKEFFKKSGDCEDYAIAKFMTLRALGWPSSKMRIVALQDLNLKVMHAILVVEQNGEFVVLDNQLSNVVKARRIKHYKPIYSVNEEGWWRHSSSSRGKSKKIKIIKKKKKQK